MKQSQTCQTLFNGSFMSNEKNFTACVLDDEHNKLLNYLSFLLICWESKFFIQRSQY